MARYPSAGVRLTLGTVPRAGGVGVMVQPRGRIVAGDISDASANAQSILTAADYAAIRVLLSLTPGTDFIAKSSFSAFIQTLIDDADAATARATLGLREVLTATRTYYVRTDGSNSNTGLVDSAGGAFLTLQKAWDTVVALDQRGFTVTIQVADGTYTGALTMSVAPTAAVIVQGNTTTPANCFINCGSVAACFYSTYRGPLVVIRGFKVATSAFGCGIQADFGARITFDRMDFGACVHSHIKAIGGYILATAAGSYNITGSAQYHYQAVNDGGIEVSSSTVTLTGTPAFSVAFADAEMTGFISAYGMTYSGSATGVRYVAAMNGAIQSFSSGASYFPGNSAGSTATGGQYA